MTSHQPPTNPRLFTFCAGPRGPWRITEVRPVVGESLATAESLTVYPAGKDIVDGCAWALRGVVSNERYVTTQEKKLLVEQQEALGRPGAVMAALIPIKKTAAWWALTQEERRKIFEEQSEHIKIGMRFLPAIARRLHHCRDLSEQEPFDFLTWFEFAPEHTAAFDELVAALRASPEWAYVEREVDIRLSAL
jgi:chlorite dismutase